MGFDCMAIGVGLFASIMATWPPNERFTYGLVASYRPRTDSKIYYQFREDRDTFRFCQRHISYSYLNIHHIRRHSAPVSLVFNDITLTSNLYLSLDPPEMNTNRLLLVSAIGLGINLFGMLAMGGHAHHGHSHSHGHGHDHSHGHDHHHAHHGVHGHDHSSGHCHDHDEDAPHEHDHPHEHVRTIHCWSDGRLTLSLQATPSPMILEYPAESDGEDVCEDHEPEHSHPSSHSHTHSHLHSSPLPLFASHPDASSQTLRPDVALRLHPHTRSRPNGFPGGDTPGVPSSRVHTRSASVTTIPPLAPPPSTPPSIPHSHTVPSLAQKVRGHRSHNRRAPSLQIHDAPHLGVLGIEPSPMTPSYRFGVDEHYASHQHTHHHGHTPNLHDHSHVHGSGHSREGHSHNMRGLFLHVMAVSGGCPP